MNFAPKPSSLVFHSQILYFSLLLTGWTNERKKNCFLLLFCTNALIIICHMVHTIFSGLITKKIAGNWNVKPKTHADKATVRWISTVLFFLFLFVCLQIFARYFFNNTFHTRWEKKEREKKKMSKQISIHWNSEQQEQFQTYQIFTHILLYSNVYFQCDMLGC